MSTQPFRPVSELNESAVREFVIERRDPTLWRGPAADAIDAVLEDEEPVYLVEDGRRVAMILPRDESLADD